MPLNSSLFRNDDKLQACLIADAAHVIPGASGKHVGLIQKGLRRISNASIDSVDLDGERYGQSTADAVLAYKQSRQIINRAYQQKPDNIVGKMTIAQLDKELLELDKKNVVNKAYDRLPEALALVRKAKARLSVVRASFTPATLTLATQERKILDWNFKVSRAKDPVAHIDAIAATYNRMEAEMVTVARLRPKLELFLFSPRHPTDPGAPAFTTLGGASFGLGDKDSRGDFSRAIYFTPEFDNKVFAASIIVHEFAHFVGGRLGTASSIGHRASPIPPPRGRALEDGVRDYAGMTAADALRNAQSYQAYCDPTNIGKPPP